MSTPTPASSSEIPAPQDNVIADALKAAEQATSTDAQKANGDIFVSNESKAKKEVSDAVKAAQMAKMKAWAEGLLHAKNRHNTPFDGRKRKIRAAKLRRAKKSNKKRILYIRDGKQ